MPMKENIPAGETDSCSTNLGFVPKAFGMDFVL